MWLAIAIHILIRSAVAMENFQLFFPLYSINCEYYAITFNHFNIHLSA